MQMLHLPPFRQLLEHEIAIVKSPIIYCDKNAIIKICRLIIFQICLSRCNYKKAQTQSSFANYVCLLFQELRTIQFCLYYALF